MSVLPSLRKVVDNNDQGNVMSLLPSLSKGLTRIDHSFGSHPRNTSGRNGV